MAAKGKAPVKAKKKTSAKVSTKVKAKPRGLQLSAAQWKAYNKAYNTAANAAYQRAALAAAAQRFRKYRLNAAISTVRAAQSATHSAQAAAIAAFAARTSWNQSRIAKQNSALQGRIRQNMLRHAALAGRFQYAQAGVKAYAHKAVMRTVTTAAATNYQAKIFNAAKRTAKKAKKSTVKQPKATSAALSAAIKRQAAAAGLKTVKRRGRPLGGKGKGKSAKVRPARQSAAKGKGHSTKAPVVKAKARTALVPCCFRPRTFEDSGWICGNNEFEGTCVMTAVANAILHQTGYWLPHEDIAYWTGRATDEHGEVTIPGVLHMLYFRQPWPEISLLEPVQLGRKYEVLCERIIGYLTETGDHAAFAFGHRQITWGEDVLVPDEIEEQWTCEFVRREAASSKT